MKVELSLVLAPKTAQQCSMDMGRMVAGSLRSVLQVSL